MSRCHRKTRKGTDSITEACRYDKQLEEIKEKGYYTRADGTKSTDAEETGKKRQSRKSKSKAGKKSSAKDANKSMKSNAGKKSGKKSETGRKSSKAKKQAEDSDGGLDIEDDSVGQSD